MNPVKLFLQIMLFLIIILLIAYCVFLISWSEICLPSSLRNNKYVKTLIGTDIANLPRLTHFIAANFIV